VSQAFVLGVDAGNSKTVALVADREGNVLGSARSGGGDVYGAETEEAAVTSVVQAVGQALGSAGLRADQVAAATLCMAGVDWPEDATFWANTLAPHLPRADLQIVNDGFALLWCAEPSGVGAAINVGTGPAIAARGSSGGTAFMAFWCQHPLGAVGLGETALRAVYLAEIGMGEPTTLREALLDWFGFGEVEELLHHFTHRGAQRSWRRAATAARSVLACAADRDPVSLALVADQADQLLAYARAMGERAGLDGGERWPLALGGGVVGSDLPVLKDALLSRAGQVLPRAVPTVVEAEPVVGSLLGALHQLDPEVAKGAFERLTDPASTDLIMGAAQ